MTKMMIFTEVPCRHTLRRWLRIHPRFHIKLLGVLEETAPDTEGAVRAHFSEEGIVTFEVDNDEKVH